jgi:SAM-dependent methyltransferase
MKDQYSAMGTPRGNLTLAVCEECGFIFNQTFDESVLKYGENYDNIQSFSCVFSDYLSHLVQHLIVERGIKNCRVIEVGCGKGLFLRKLAERGENICYGFDPSYVGPDTDLDGRLHFLKCYYGPEWGEIEADVVVSRHVIEHVQDPLDLLNTIRQSLANSPKAMVFFETPCVEWILRNQVIWDFFYEHCSYFSIGSLSTAFEATGFKIESIQHVFEDQYLWLEATVSFDEQAVKRKAGIIPYLANKFGKSERVIKGILSDALQNLKTEGNIALWGAGAKGVTLANLLDPERDWITCVVDLNPRKQGGYIPGTGHPIIGYQQMLKYAIRTAVLMNSNYRQENLALLRESHLNIQLIDLMDLLKGTYEAHY